MAILMDADFDDVPPDASSMIESMRAHGYTLSTALADIIDNSIAAKCCNVWLKFDWSNGSPWISITDDGYGMSEKDLVTAMRLGSQNPLDERSENDLGRFGLGLKTASFSQARRLTVYSVKDSNAEAIRRWDLDHLAKPGVSGWQLLRSPHVDSGDRYNGLKDHEAFEGTTVLLELLDRLVPSGTNNGTDLLEPHWVSEIARVREHLAMVFHRFLSDTGQSGIKIWINESMVEPWDPFCSNEEATQSEPEDVNADLGPLVKVKGYVLPHRDRFDPTDAVRSGKRHRRASGPRGWNDQQGFYLYRNRRLIIPGDWLGLGPGQNGWQKEEHFKLARIRVDIPNSMDQEWQIDVKKSTAIAPPALRNWLTGLAKTFREKAKEVYAFRGGRPARRRNTRELSRRPWISKTKPDGTFSYRIDRGHPLFRALMHSVSEDSKEQLETLLRLIEETVPVQRIWIDTADNQDGVAEPFHDEASAKLKTHIKVCYKALVDNGMQVEEAWNEVSGFPAFQTALAKALMGQLQE